jgi:hypothetical protein
MGRTDLTAAVLSRIVCQSDDDEVTVEPACCVKGHVSPTFWNSKADFTAAVNVSSLLKVYHIGYMV